jgi:hypothetical protein
MMRPRPGCIRPTGGQCSGRVQPEHVRRRDARSARSALVLAESDDRLVEQVRGVVSGSLVEDGREVAAPELDLAAAGRGRATRPTCRPEA